MPFSIHMCRWINNFQDENYDIHIYSSMPYVSDLYNEFKGVTFHVNLYFVEDFVNDVKYVPVDIFGYIKFKTKKANNLFSKIVRFFGFESNIDKGLIKTFKKIKPDIVHSMESQNAGYLVSNNYSKLIYNKTFKWVHSVWGIDFEHYINNNQHLFMLKNMLLNIEHLIVEGKRDVDFAKGLGYEKNISILQCTGGYTPEEINKYILKNEVRKFILLKGQNKYPRMALLGLIAILKAERVLIDNNIDLIIHSIDDELESIVNRIKSKARFKIKILKHISRNEFLVLNLNSLISITINDSDGMPNSMLDAMLCGAFPIQSDRSCATDIIKNGINGFLVNPYDVDDISNKINIACNSNSLLKNAAKINQAIISDKFNWQNYKIIINNIYNYNKKN